MFQKHLSSKRNENQDLRVPGPCSLMCTLIRHCVESLPTGSQKSKQQVLAVSLALPLTPTYPHTTEQRSSEQHLDLAPVARKEDHKLTTV